MRRGLKKGTNELGPLDDIESQRAIEATATTGAEFHSGHKDASRSALDDSSISFRRPSVVPTTLLLPHKAADADCVASTAEQEIGAELAGIRSAGGVLWDYGRPGVRGSARPVRWCCRSSSTEGWRL